MFDVAAVYEPETAAGAVAFLQANPRAILIAGGSDVLVKARGGGFSDCILVSIQHLDALRGVMLEEDGALRIGSITSFTQLQSSPLISEHLPVLGDAAAQVGGPQIRNSGTIGGNICNGAPSADTASTLLAFDALVEYTGVDGTRRIPVSEHYVGAGKTSRKHDELLSAIIIPKASYERTSGVYLKYAMRNAMDIATLGCSANLMLQDDGKTVERLRLAFGVAAPIPVRASGVEELARGKVLDRALIERVARAVPDDIHPRDSWRASREFRLHLAEELTRRALAECASKRGRSISP